MEWLIAFALVLVVIGAVRAWREHRRVEALRREVHEAVSPMESSSGRMVSAVLAIEPDPEKAAAILAHIGEGINSELDRRA